MPYTLTCEAVRLTGAGAASLHFLLPVSPLMLPKAGGLNSRASYFPTRCIHFLNVLFVRSNSPNSHKIR